MRLVELTKRNGAKVVINVAHVVHLASLANHTRISFAFAFTPKEAEGQMAYYLDVQEELEEVVQVMRERIASAIAA